MYVLKGVAVISSWAYEEDSVALFSSADKAKRYICDNRLAYPCLKSGRKFRAKSLLAQYDDAWFEPYEGEDLPIDPE